RSFDILPAGHQKLKVVREHLFGMNEVLRIPPNLFEESFCLVDAHQAWICRIILNSSRAVGLNNQQFKLEVTEELASFAGIISPRLSKEDRNGRNPFAVHLHRNTMVIFWS